MFRYIKIKTLIIFTIIFFYTYSQDDNNIIYLLPVDKSSGKPLMECLAKRKSTREFSDSSLSLQHISNLLWAACGINRSDSKKRTVPSAFNAQETEIWIATKNGVYLYNPENHTLIKKVNEDIRDKCGKQGFVKNAPIIIIYVSDINKIDVKISDNEKLKYAATDIGFISQNIYLYCASEDLATVIIGLLDKENLAKILKLPENKKVMYTQPIGYKKTQ